MKDLYKKMSGTSNTSLVELSCSSWTKGATENQPSPVFLGQPSILSVVVHYASCVKANMLTGQLAVKLSFVDEQTGDLVKKSDRNRAAVSYYENNNPSVDYIMPLLTQAASCVMTRSADVYIWKWIFWCCV